MRRSSSSPVKRRDGMGKTVPKGYQNQNDSNVSGSFLDSYKQQRLNKENQNQGGESPKNWLKMRKQMENKRVNGSPQKNNQ